MSAHLQTRWQRNTLLTLFTGYAGYYVCRSNLSVATPLILDEFEGFTKEDIGVIASTGVLVYALGKISNGLLADFFGGRTLFLLGMVGSVVATVLFGLGSGLVVFATLWMLNRYFQSMGWVSLVKTASRWFPVRRHATVMGILSMSYLIGDAITRLYLGEAIHAGFGWRELFFLSAATLAVMSAVVFFTLKPSPASVGVEEPQANPRNVFGEKGNQTKPENLTDLLRPLLRSRTFWLMCTISFGLTLIRETFTFWTPTFLNEVTGLGAGEAAVNSLLFPLVGAGSALLAGLLSDRLGGRHGLILLPALVMLVVALGALVLVPLAGRPALALVLISAVSFFLIGPYTLLAGVMSLDLGGKKGSSTTAGLVDSAGYLGAVLSGILVGSLAHRYGWSAAFGFLAVVGVLTAAVSLYYWIHHDREHRRTASR